MPQVFYQCDNFINCQGFVEKPGLCKQCKEDARKLAEQIAKENEAEGMIFLSKKNRRRNHNHWRSS